MSPETNDAPTIRLTRGADQTTMSPSGIRLHARRYELLALALATPALWRAGLWLIVALTLFFVVRVIRFTTSQVGRGEWGPATLIVLPARLFGGILSAIPPLLVAAIASVAAMAVGFILVGSVVAFLGFIDGLIAYHDSGWLLWADAQSSIVRWAPRFGFAVAAFYLARRAFIPKVRGNASSGSPSDANVGAVSGTRAFVDQIGETGLVALSLLTLVLLLGFSLTSISVWKPADGYRGAAGVAHLTQPMNRTLTRWVLHDTRVALENCAPISNFSDTVIIDSKISLLAVTITPTTQTNPADDLVLAAALVSNRVVPVVDTVTFTALDATGKPAIITSLVIKNHHSTVLRSPIAVIRHLSPTLTPSSNLAGMSKLLRSCKA